MKSLLRPFYRPAWRNLCAALLGMGLSAWCQSCPEGGTNGANLPPEIGSAHNVKPPHFVLRCDTMIVPKGRTTVIYPGALLYFATPNAANLIRVEGTLELRGAKDHYVSLAGGANTNEATAAKNVPWGGILVDPDGKLTVDFAGFYGASTPITAFSTDVKIENSFFTGGTGIIKPDGTFYALDPQFTAINALDFNASASMDAPPPAGKNSAPSDTLSPQEKAALFQSPHTGFWSSPVTWIVGGGVILASGAIGYYALRPAATAQKSSSGQTSGSGQPGMDPLPSTNF